MPALRDGHRIELLQGAHELFAAMVRAIDAARTEVLVETYIFDLTASGADVAAALVHAARRGVRVQLLMDGIGTPELPPDWAARFDDAGVQWHRYAPLGWLGLLIPNRWRRLHRKLCVVDGGLGFCGGINVLDDLHDPNHGVLQHPRLDYAVRVQGPLVADMRDAVQQLWRRTQAMRAARARDFAAAWESIRLQPRHASGPTDATTLIAGAPGAMRAGVIFRDNVRERRTIEKGYLKAIGEAQHEVVIANAYFLPGRRLRRALVMAMRRGVRVRLLLQGRYEYFMQYHASRPVYGLLLAHCAEIHEYTPSFLHTKMAVIDAQGLKPWATVGSSNLDPLSLLLAREANVVVRDSAFAGELHARLLKAIEHQGQPVLPEAYARRTLATRALGWLAYGLMRFALLIAGKRY